MREYNDPLNQQINRAKAIDFALRFDDGVETITELLCTAEIISNFLMTGEVSDVATSPR